MSNKKQSLKKIFTIISSMKKTIITLTFTISTLFLLNSCSSKVNISPSQNSALNSISNSGGKAKAGYMQKSMDSWIQNDWTPEVSQNKEIQKKYMKKVEDSTIHEEIEKQDANKLQTPDVNVQYKEDENRNFTLQEYVDKAAVYGKSHPADEKSNVKKLESMPVIGK